MPDLDLGAVTLRAELDIAKAEEDLDILIKKASELKTLLCEVEEKIRSLNIGAVPNGNCIEKTIQNLQSKRFTPL